MDINTWRGIATIVVMVTFVGICMWAYSARRRKGFDEAANLPFADEQRDDGNDSDSKRH